MVEILEQMFMMHPVLQETVLDQIINQRLEKPILIIIQLDLREAMISRIDLVQELMISLKEVLQDLQFLTTRKVTEALQAVTKVAGALPEAVLAQVDLLLPEVVQVQVDLLLPEVAQQEAVAAEALLQDLVDQEVQDNFEIGLLKEYSLKEKWVD